jgi:hypothetical protein
MNKEALLAAIDFANRWGIGFCIAAAIGAIGLAVVAYRNWGLGNRLQSAARGDGKRAGRGSAESECGPAEADRGRERARRTGAIGAHESCLGEPAASAIVVAEGLKSRDGFRSLGTRLFLEPAHDARKLGAHDDRGLQRGEPRHDKC